jgi:hypothetical protein
MRAAPKAPWRKLARRFACLVMLGAALAGCDKCGDFLSAAQGEMQACRQQAPRPQ